ncbi:unnamed protein product, partial [marine sediment metagenome]
MFHSLIERFENEKSNLLITARDYDSTYQILDDFDINYKKIGKHGGERLDNKLETYINRLKAVKYINSHDYDIFHGNAPKGTLPIILSKRNRFITTIHDLGPFETTFTKIPIEKYFIKLAVNGASIITTVSNFIKREINILFQ